jgi:glutamyl-tRNA reductase
VVNRSRERAERIGQRYHALVYGFEEIVEAISASDVVISATAAPSTIIRARDVEAAVGGRHARPLVMIDVALPRDIEPLAGNLPGVRLFNMDHLRETLDKALTARRKEIPQVETIIAEEVEILELHYREFAVQPLIVNLRKKAEAIRQQELERTFRFIGDELDPETREHIQHLSRSLVNKLLHNPTVRLRQVAGNGQASRYASTVSDLFDLDPSHNA